MGEGKALGRYAPRGVDIDVVGGDFDISSG